MNIMNFIFCLFLNCLLGFLINLFVFSLVLIKGYFGFSLQELYKEKLNRKDSIWFNKLLLYYFLICIICIYFTSTNIIYLDDGQNAISIIKIKDGNISEKFQNTGMNITENVVIKDLLILDTHINSPIEPGDLNVTIKNQVLELLGLNLNIHFIMIYLLLMCLFLLTIKFIIDSKVSLDFIKNWPMGNIIYNLINKLLNVWSKTNIYWLYFLLLSLLVMMIGSTYGLYGSIVLLN